MDHRRCVAGEFARRETCSRLKTFSPLLQPIMDDYCAYASRIANPAEFHAITGASARDSGDMEQLVAPKPVCIAFMSWSSPECRKFGPVYDDVTRQFANCRFYWIDVENEDAAKLALEQDVGPDRQLPVFKMFRDGIELRPAVEGARRDELVAALQRLAA